MLVGGGSSESSDTAAYSSMHCIGGSQTFEDWKLEPYRFSFESREPNSVDNRACLLRNVCFGDKSIYFYEENDPTIPTFVKASSFQVRILSDYVFI